MTWIITPEWTAKTTVLYASLTIAALASGVAERKGWTGVRYSKFRSGKGMSSRLGMFIIYAVPVVTHLLSLLWFVSLPLSAVQWIFSVAICSHFAKRCLEVLFLHKYSGPIAASTVMPISLAYGLVSGYAAYLLPRMVSGVDALVAVGAALFVIGQAGNFYHHKLLANLRANQDGYFVPTGGMFEWLTCPHYFFEVVAWLALALMSRHIDLLLVAVMMASYLTGRSVKARDWYLARFPDYPAKRRNLFPFVY